MRLISSIVLSTTVAAIFIGGYSFRVTGLASLAMVISFLEFAASILVISIVFWLRAGGDVDRVAT